MTLELFHLKYIRGSEYIHLGEHVCKVIFIFKDYSQAKTFQILFKVISTEGSFMYASVIENIYHGTNFSGPLSIIS